MDTKLKPKNFKHTNKPHNMIKHTIRFMDQTDSPYYKSKILYVYTLSTLPFRFSDEVCAPIQIPSSFRNPMFKSKVIVPCKLL